MQPRTLAAASIAGLLLLALAPPPAAFAEEDPTPEDPTPEHRTTEGPTATGSGQQILTVVLPEGDPRAGREAFRALMCTSCHAVAEDESSPPKITAPVPVLGRVQARLEPSEVASAILSPSHEISPEVRPSMEGTLSPMADFSHVLTVRQLVDLVAYIRSLG